MSDLAPSNPNTQLPVGPTPWDTGTWRVSLAEIEAMCRKAARGAGFSWGMAEEAGRAARLLACHDLPGPEAMSRLLPNIDEAVGRFAPRPEEEVWNSEAGELCPLSLGAALSDRAADLAGGLRVETGPVLYPILVLPFLIAAGRDLDIAFALEAAEFSAGASATGPSCNDWATFAILERTAGLSVARADGPAPHPRPRQTLARQLDVKIWRELDSFAKRTYAPSTEESRRSGAGAGIADRD